MQCEPYGESCLPGYLSHIKFSYFDSRAQHDAVARKFKLEAKQGKGAVKKQAAVDPTPGDIELKSGHQTSKLVSQIAVLKDQNKSLEGRVQVWILLLIPT